MTQLFRPVVSTYLVVPCTKCNESYSFLGLSTYERDVYRILEAPPRKIYHLYFPWRCSTYLHLIKNNHRCTRGLKSSKIFQGSLLNTSMIAIRVTFPFQGTLKEMLNSHVKNLSASLHEGQQCHRANYVVALKRSSSCPTIMKLRSSMRVASLDESLHNFDISRSRGSVASSVEALPTLAENDPRNVIFDEIRIREYERSLGDNPSCSSGPPIRYVAFLVLELGWMV